MSTKALFWALEQRIPTNPKMVLIHLSDWFNELEDSAWPSIPKLVERTGLSRSTVIRSTQWLIDKKLVVVEHRFAGGWKRSNRYRLAIGVMILQGCQGDTTVVSEPTGLRCQSDTTVEHTIKDTIKDTINLADEPQEQSNVKVNEFLADKKQAKSKDEIFDRYTPTPKGCGDFWRDARASSGEHGFAAELLNKDWKMLDNARKRVGDDFPDILWKVMQNWIGFTKHAESTAGAFNVGIKPTVKKFCLYVEAAADYNLKNKPVQLTAKPAKPLTNKPEPSTHIPKATEPAITLAELLAMNEDDE